MIELKHSDIKTDSIESRIMDVINNLKPYLISDGGNIDFIKYEDNIVYVKLYGACTNCQMMDVTLKDGIAAVINDEVPEVKEVITIL